MPEENLDIEDPYVYRHRARLRIPKYLVHASGDQFFLPDNSRFYFKDLEGEKYIRYVPNTRHNLGGSDARESLLTFYQSILANRPRPKFSWTGAADGSIRVDVTDRPASVNLWQATNPKARDFRLDVIGAAYTSTRLMEESPGVYVARVVKPAEGFTAFFVELVYDSGFRNPWKFTTSMKGSLESRDTCSERSASGLSSHPDARSERVSTTLGRLSSHAPGA